MNDEYYGRGPSPVIRRWVLRKNTVFFEQISERKSKSDFFGVLDADELQSLAENVARAACERDTNRFFIRIFARRDGASLVKSVESTANIEDIARNYAGLHAVDGFLHLFGEEGECLDKVALRFFKVFHVFGKRYVCAFTELVYNAAGSCVGVLCVRTCVAVKVERVFHNEVDVAHTVCSKVVEYDRANADSFCRFVLVLHIGVLFFHNGANLVYCNGKEIAQEDDVARSCGELFSVYAYCAVRNVVELGSEIVTHKLNYLEPLREVEGLPCGGNVDTLIKVVRSVAVNSRRNVARGVKSGAIALEDKARGHIVFGKVNDGRAVVDFHKIFISEYLNLLRHFVRVEAFTVVAVKSYAELVVGCFVFRKANVDKPSPKGEVFFIVVFEFCKFGSCFVCKGGVFFGFFVEFNVKLNELVDTAVFNIFAAAPFAVSNDKLAELRTPVAKMVDAYAIIALILVKKLEGMADDRCAEVTDVEGFCNVGGGIVENDSFACTYVCSAEVCTLLCNSCKDIFCKKFDGGEKLM